jgi:hypothetical protein
MSNTVGRLTPEVARLFDREGLVRYHIVAEPDAPVDELAAGPFVSLGARDSDFVLPPDPVRQGYPEPDTAQRSLEDYHIFLYRWLEAAVGAEKVGCAYCGKTLRDADDLPDAETWDVVLVEAELVAWLPIHFDCKRWIPKRLKGLSPFAINAGDPPELDLSGLRPKDMERPGNE